MSLRFRPRCFPPLPLRVALAVRLGCLAGALARRLCTKRFVGRGIVVTGESTLRGNAFYSYETLS